MDQLRATLEPQSLVLNRFFVKQLTPQDCTVYEYQCHFATPPASGDEQKAIASLCYKLGVIGVRLGSAIITKAPIDPDRSQGDGWTVRLCTEARRLQCQNPGERQALETFERKFLERRLKSQFRKTVVSRAGEGGLIWSISGPDGLDHQGNGWAIQRGRHVDVHINSNGELFLDIDVHFRFYTPWTLQQWFDAYPDSPVTYVRNTYPDHNSNDYRTWFYLSSSEEHPEHVQLGERGISLAEYHRRLGASEVDIQTSQVIYVQSLQRPKSQHLAHLSQRVSPSLTMDMLASALEMSNNASIRSVFNQIRPKLDSRLKDSQQAAQKIKQHIYRITTDSPPLAMAGFRLPPAQLLAAQQQPVTKVADVRQKGCAKIGEQQFGCLNLFNTVCCYPEAVRQCLEAVARSSKVELSLESYRTRQDYPKGSLDQHIFWQTWASEGIKTVLVVMPRTTPEAKQQIRNQALQAGIATQFMVPLPKANAYKAMNVTLGLLCKAGWQPIHLQPFDHPEYADLVIGFDTGTNRELYYGTSAFAVLANGQSLGWELPDIQRGETFSGEAIRQTVSRLVLRYYQVCGCYPKKLLLMRDGLVQADEFERTIQELADKSIAVDVISVRKSGAGRMGFLESGHYRDATLGSVVFLPQERSFTVVTSQPVSTAVGSVRPLRVVHTHGQTPLELLAIQTYHLTRLHPASGYSSCRLPWVLHLADRSSKEFQRIKQMSILQVISREKLIAV